MHLHLVTTHLPIFGCILGAIVLSYAIWTKSNHTTVAAYMLLIISSAGAVVAYLTGEPAEEAIENIQAINTAIIEKHEDFAQVALIAIVILGIISVVGLFQTLKKSSFVKPIALVTLFIALLCFGFVARTGYFGGQIRHTETKSTLPEHQIESKSESD